MRTMAASLLSPPAAGGVSIKIDRNGPGGVAGEGGKLFPAPWNCPRWGRPAAPDGGTGAESPVVSTLRVVGAVTRPRGAAPRGPACPAGSPFLPRNGEKEGRGSTSGPPVLWPARCHSLVWGLWRMVPVVGLLRCPGACPDLGASFRGIFWGHIGGHVEQNSVCRDTNAVDERNQPHLVFWLYFITFLQYFPLFFGFLFRLGGPPARWLLRTLWVVGAFPVPRGAAPRCPPGPGRGPGFLWKKAGGKNTREEEVLPPWTHLFRLGGPCGGPLFFLPGLRPIFLRP